MPARLRSSSKSAKAVTKAERWKRNPIARAEGQQEGPEGSGIEELSMFYSQRDATDVLERKDIWSACVETCT